MQRYAITDRQLLWPAPNHASLCAHVQQWVAAGVEWVQLREKDLPPEELAALVQTLSPIVRMARSRTRLMVNLGGDHAVLDPRIVLNAGAHGLHLPGAASVEQIAAMRRLSRLVSVSCHTLDEVRAARTGGADAVLWAPVFSKTLPTGTVLPGSGLVALRTACLAASPVPVFALGGVSVGDAPAVAAAGAAGMAGIRLFLEPGWQGIA